MHIRDLPGAIDTHVHTREPGFEHKATMATEAASALAGGVTTMCEMPNTNPATTTIDALRDKVVRAARTGFDFRFYFGMTNREHLKEFERLMESDDPDVTGLRRHIAGVKLFLEHSTGDQKIPEALVPDVFAACANYNTLLMAHCEDPLTNARAAAQNTRTDIAAHSVIRPPESEAASIKYALELVHEFNTRFHIAHLSTASGLELVREAKGKGLPVTCEATTHHLFCTEDDYPKLGARIKMNPPIRSRDNLVALWGGIQDGTIDNVVTDHAPHTPAEKAAADPLKNAPSGVPGVETMVPLLMTVASGRWPHPESDPPADGRLITHADMMRLVFSSPNETHALGKKTPAEGGDVITVDLDAEWTIDETRLKSKAGWSPYHGWQMKGKVLDVKQTF